MKRIIFWLRYIWNWLVGYDCSDCFHFHYATDIMVGWEGWCDKCGGEWMCCRKHPLTSACGDFSHKDEI